MDQDRIIYIVVDRVGAPYRVLLYQLGIRFILGTSSKVSSLQQQWSLVKGHLANMANRSYEYFPSFSSLNSEFSSGLRIIDTFLECISFNI